MENRDFLVTLDHKDLRVYVASKVPLDLLVHLDPLDHLADQDLEALREREESLVNEFL